MEEKPASIEEQRPTPPPLEQPEKELPTPSLIDKLKTHKFKIIVGVLAVLVFASGIFSAYQLGQRQSQLQPSPTPEAVATPTPDPTADWKTYTNTKYGYEIKYPEKWFLEKKVDLVKFYNQDPNIYNFERTREISSGVLDYPKEDFIFDISIIENVISEPDLAQKSTTEIGGLEGVKGILTGGEGEKILMGYVIKNGKTYTFYGRPADSNDKEVFNLMLSTFKFLEEENLVPSPTTLEKISYQSISTWQTYNDSQAEFSVQYPENYKLSSSDPGKEVIFWSCVDNPEIGELCMSGYMIRIYEDYDGGSRRSWFEKLRPNFLIDPYYEDVYVVGIKALIIMDGNLGGSTGSSVLIPKGNKMFLFDFPNGWNPETKEKPGLDFIKQVLSTFQFLD